MNGHFIWLVFLYCYLLLFQTFEKVVRVNNFVITS